LGELGTIVPGVIDGEEPLWPVGISPTDEFIGILEFIASDQANLFVTGRAGTGKSTLLRAFAKSVGHQLLIAAPTGIAALNVGGETLHSLFRLPRGLLIDGEESAVAPRDVFQIDPVTLIIDEASMVRADAMNAIDMALRETAGNRRAVRRRADDRVRRHASAAAGAHASRR
jgi:ATP-dependent DNA helicase PIF1